jgi:hypothetical protein
MSVGFGTIANPSVFQCDHMGSAWGKVSSFDQLPPMKGVELFRCQQLIADGQGLVSECRDLIADCNREVLL